MTDTITKGLIFKNDLSVFSGGSKTGTRKTSTGGTQTLNKIDWVGIDAYQIYGSVYGKTESTIDAAVKNVSGNCELFLSPGTWVVSNDYTVPSTVNVKIAPGCSISIDTGKTITFNSPLNIIAQPNQQLFAGDGSVAFTNPGRLYPEWFGSGTGAVQSAVSSLLGGGTIELTTSTYISTKVTIGVDLTLDIKQSATLKLADNTDDILVYVDSSDRFDLVGSGTIDGNKANNTTTDGTVEVESVANVNIGSVTIKDAAGDAVKITTATNGLITPIITDADGSGVHTVDCDNLDIRPDIDTCEKNGVIVIPTSKNCNNIRVGGYIKSPAQTGTPYMGVYFNSGDTYYVTNSFISSIVEDAGYVGIYPGGDFNTVTDAARVNGAGEVTSASGYGIWVHDSAHITIGAAVVGNGENAGILVNKSHNVTLSGTLSYRNAGAGFWFDYDAAATGRYQTTDTNQSVTCNGCMAIENSFGDVGTYPGFYIDGFRDLNIVGCHAHDYQGTQSQDRGVVAATNGSTSRISIIGCNFEDNISANGINVARAYLAQCYGNSPDSSDFFITGGNAYDTQPFVMGTWYLWVDTTGDLRINNGAPTGDTDGAIVGTQS